MQTDEILNKNEYSPNDICHLLKLSEQNDLQKLQNRANEILFKNIGNDVFIRGLIEFSNYCICDCNYCGIRKSNSKISRYQLTFDEIIDCVNLAKKMNFVSVVLQSGERNDEKFIDYVLEIIKVIKEKTKSEKLPNGFGITLSIGEQTEENYKKLFDAGAARFLLRIETTNQNIFEKIHSKSEKLHHKDISFDKRLKSISILQKIGFQVGTGVMIGLPEQTIEDLANDIIFFKENDIDMLGMGAYIPHKNTPLGQNYFTENNFHSSSLRAFEKCVAISGNSEEIATPKRLAMTDSNYRLQLSLNMIAVARIVLKDVNIASTTALETLSQNGRILGLQYGANVVMPQFTPNSYKANYLLYDKKPLVDETETVLKNFTVACENIGRKVAFGKSGTSQHFVNRK